MLSEKGLGIFRIIEAAIGMMYLISMAQSHH